MPGIKKQNKSVRRDILRYEDNDYMRDLMNKMMKYRIEDKVAFRNKANDYDKKSNKASKVNNNNSNSNSNNNNNSSNLNNNGSTSGS
jgi:hypothetical protein